MSHRKVHSQGSVPFSWEYKPGVSKSSNLSHYDQYNITIDGPPSTSIIGDSSTNVMVRDNKVPPPPPLLNTVASQEEHFPERLEVVAR
ncbi:hypothetical protein V6N11_044039 [Hibiscus sabdariffa]|uniref:Uncharacterized protein n=2 Tax=Hibiscus sabdariffa TaxID=183260 RepID=A0ABR1ZIV0_9ROSI